MLVLTRKYDQDIRIGDDINVKVVEVRGDKVRLGIEAPREVPIMRAELKNDVDRTRHALRLLASSSLTGDAQSAKKKIPDILVKLKSAQALAQKVIPQTDFREDIDEPLIEQLVPEDIQEAKLEKLKPVIDFVEALASYSSYQSNASKVEAKLKAATSKITAA